MQSVKVTFNADCKNDQHTTTQPTPSGKTALTSWVIAGPVWVGIREMRPKAKV